jgi:hypothetical protein
MLSLSEFKSKPGAQQVVKWSLDHTDLSGKDGDQKHDNSPSGQEAKAASKAGKTTR